MKYTEVNPFTGKNIDEDAPANATGPSVAGTGDDNTVHTMRKKKKKTLFDGRTKIAKKFIDRILKQIESRLKAVTKEEVNKAYIKIQKKIHPDISPETSRLSSLVNEAKEIVLRDIG